jgi:ParB family chromosome partitioning protein
MVRDGDSQRRLATKIIEFSLSVRETEKAVKRVDKENNQPGEKKQNKPKIDANVRMAETKLRRQLGTHVNILPDGKGTGGKIEIEYYSNSDLDRLYSLITSK